MANSERFSYGFEVDRLAEFHSRYHCIFCSLIINNPIQLTECGHRSCLDCFKTRADETTDGNVMCPVDDCHAITHRNSV